MKVSDWNNLRAKLHHDWLQNSYLTFLMARASYLDDSLYKRKIIRQDIVDEFFEFKSQMKRFDQLFKEAMEALSPRQLLNNYPLNKMTSDNKDWIGELVHALYLNKTNIVETIDRLNKQLSFLYDYHSLLYRLLEGEKDQLMKEIKTSSFKTFLSLMQDFSKNISALPHEVQTI